MGTTPANDRTTCVAILSDTDFVSDLLVSLNYNPPTTAITIVPGRLGLVQGIYLQLLHQCRVFIYNYYIKMEKNWLQVDACGPLLPALWSGSGETSS